MGGCIDLSDIESWEYVEIETTYDISVKDNHNYYLDCGYPVLVHNSRKTRSVIDFIVYLCLHVEKRCIINILKETYNEFKTTLYNDFIEVLDEYGLENPFDRVKEIPSFKIGKNIVNFIGADQPNKFMGASCDYLYFNEMIPIDQEIYRQTTMRCSKMWIGDYNPSVTEHYIFSSVITRPDVGFLRTTFKDNPFIPKGQLQEILSYEPWLPGSYYVKDDTTVYYNGNPISATNYPPEHPENVKNGTADEYHWLVFGLGLRGAMKGVIFDKVEYIDKFPDIAYTYGLDLGFTTDPCALTRCAEDDYNIWIEPLSYQPIDTPEALSEYMDAIGVERYLPITCDSADKYTGENKGTIEMVLGLQSLGWQAFKVSKTKSVMYWLASMKKKKIHVVRNQFYKQVKSEFENYKFKEINGISINMPIDKWNHVIDSARYNHIAYNSNISLETEWH